MSGKVRLFFFSEEKEWVKCFLNSARQSFPAGVLQISWQLRFERERFEREQMQIKGQENVFFNSTCQSFPGKQSLLQIGWQFRFPPDMFSQLKVFRQDRVFWKLVDNSDLFQTCKGGKPITNKVECNRLSLVWTHSGISFANLNI